MKTTNENLQVNREGAFLFASKNRHAHAMRVTGIVLLFICLLFSVCFVTFGNNLFNKSATTAYAADETMTTWDGTAEAWNNAIAVTDGSPQKVRLDGDWTSALLTVAAGKDITLDLNGHTLKRNVTKATASGYVITVSGKLTIIDDSTAKNGKITGGWSSSSRTAGAIYVAANGSVVMKSGTISGNKTTSTYSGAAVYLVNSTSSFTMEGGTITGNTSTGNYGAGAVNLYNGGKFTMTGGTVTGNTGTGTNSDGAAYVDANSSFTMTGGSITSNNGSLTGGLFLAGSNSQLIMSGGSITGNTASSVGGVYVNNGARMTITGGTISGNTASHGGIYVGASGRLTLGGNPVIANNTHNGSSTDIFIEDASGTAATNYLYLDGTLQKPASPYKIIRRGVGPLTSGWTGSTDPEAVKEYFSNEDSNYQFNREANDPAPLYSGSEVFLYNYRQSLPNWVYYQPLATSLGASTPVTIKLYSDWTAAGNSINGYGTDATCFINGALLVPASANIILDLNGKVLSRNCSSVIANGYSFNVSGILRIEDDSAEKSGVITGGYSNTSSTTGGIYINTTGKVTLAGGTLTGNRATGATSGSAVYVAPNANASFTMEGGTITGNTALTGANSGTVLLNTSSKFTMTGGEITANTSSGSNGSAVAVRGSNVVELTKGKITDNVTAGYGLYGAGTFTFRLGSSVNVSGNKTSGDVNRNIYLAGGTINITAKIDAGLTYGITKGVGAVTSNFGLYNPDVKPNDVFYTENGSWLLINDKYGDIHKGASSTAEATMLSRTSHMTNWTYALDVSNSSNPGTFTLLDEIGDWNAVTCTRYKTTFGTSGTAYTDAANGYIYYGALQIPASRNVVVDLNGHTVNRALTVAYTYGNVFRVLGKLNVIDCSTAQTGKITGGWTSGAGLAGAIWQVSGTTVIDGGTITGNTVTSASYAGGVYVASGTFEMNGGTITGNTGGYGVYVGSGVRLTLDGNALITGNTGNYGLYVSNANCTFRLGGSARVYGNTSGGNANVYLPENFDTVIITSKLTKPSSAQRMGITRNRVDYFTADWSTYNGSANPSEYFVSENSVYQVSSSLKYDEAQMLSFDNAANWRSAVESSVMHGTTETVVLHSNWTAASHDTYKTSFAAGTYTAEGGSYFYGALQVPASAKIVLDLNGYKINRALTAAYAYGYAIMVRGNLEIRDSSASGAGAITGAFCSGAGGGINLTAGTLTITSGTITGNKATSGAGVYFNSGTVFNLGGSTKITGNTTAEGVAANINIVSGTGKINIISKLTGGATFGVTRGAVGEITSGFGLYNPGHAYDTFVTETSGFTLIEWGSGATTEAYMLSTNNYTNWVYYLGQASLNNPQTIPLVSDWNAGTCSTSYNYQTSFGLISTQYTADTGYFFYGALQVPANKSIILDLNGYTLNRRLSSAYARGFVIRVLGNLTIIDSSSSQTGKITGGYSTIASAGSGIWLVSGSLTVQGGTITGNRTTGASAGGVWIGAGTFTMTGGAVTGNSGNSAGGVYINSGTVFNVGGSARICDNTSSNVVFANGSQMTNVVSTFANNARIGISRGTNNFTSTEGTVFTHDYGKYNSADPSKHFFNTASASYRVINYKLGTDLEGAMWCIDNAKNWNDALTASTATAPKTFILYSDWNASVCTTGSYIYQTSFGVVGTRYTATDGIYFYGALQVPDTKSIIINLNGYKINRALNSAYGQGYVIINRGTLEVIDTSAAKTGQITGGYCSAAAGGINHTSGSLTLNGGTITGNRATSGAGVYVAGNLAFRIGGRIKITGNTTAAGVPANIYMPSRAMISVTSKLTGGATFGVAKPNDGNGTFTSGFVANNPGVNVTDVFKSENATLRLIEDGNGEGYFLSTDNYTNWVYFLGQSSLSSPQTIVLSSNWTAHAQTATPNYYTSFGAVNTAYTADTDYFYYGALQVPANKSIILDLNGYTINRNLSAGYARGYVLRVLGNLTIIDSSKSQTGKITGGYTSTANTSSGVWIGSGSLTLQAGTLMNNRSVVAAAGGVWVSSGTFTMTGGSIINNSGNSAGGVYVAGGTSFNVGNNAKIYDNSSTNVVFANTSLRANVVSPLVRGAQIGITRDNNNFTSASGSVFTSNYGQFNSEAPSTYFFATDSANYKVIDYGSGSGLEGAMWCVSNYLNWQRAVEASSDSTPQTFVLYSDWTAAVCTTGSYIYNRSFGAIGTRYTDTAGNFYYGALQVPSGRNVVIDLNGFTINRALTAEYAQGYTIVNRGRLTVTDSSKKQTGKITGAFSTNGGGIWSSGTLTLTSGNITGNKAANGAGVYVSSGALNLSGTIKINNNTTSAGAARNIWLPGTSVINVTSKLADNATYGVTRAGVGAFTSGFSRYNPGVESTDVFTSENSAYFVYDDEVTDEDGNVLYIEAGMMANNPTLNWQFFVNASLKNGGKTYTVTLGSDWTALKQTSPNYRTTFGTAGTAYTNVAGAYFYGAIQVPAGASMILDLNGHTINRAMTASYSYGYVIIVRGSLTIIDSSDEKTGRITGGWYDNNVAGIYSMGNLNVRDGTISGNKGHGILVYSGTTEITGGAVTSNTNYGVYVNKSGTLKLGGSAKIYNGGTVNTTYPQGNLNVGFEAASQKITVVSKFNDDAKIGITRDNNNFTSTGGSLFTAGYGQYNSDEPAKYFYASDTPRYRVISYDDSNSEASMWCIDNYLNWTRAVDASSPSVTQTFVLYSNWNAATSTSTYNYKTTFGALSTGYTATSGNFFYGALQVPSGKSVKIDLNGYTISRALTAAYSYGYVVINRGNLTIVDSSDLQTGKMTGGWNSGGAGCVYSVGGNLTITGGEISGNKATAGAGVYVSGGNFNLGGNPKIINNTTAAGVPCNTFIPATGKINIVSELTGDSKFGITRSGNGVFTKNLSLYNSGAPEDYFVSESVYYEVIEEGEDTSREASMLSTVASTNWAYFVNKSLSEGGKTYTVKLRDNWTAANQSSPNYKTAFNPGYYTAVSTPYFRGAIQLPAGASIILDLNGFTIDRRLTAGYSYGYNIVVRGNLTIIDSSASQTGKITGGFCSSTGAGGIYVYSGTLTMLGGTVTGNRGSVAGGIYVNSATGLNIGGSAKVYGNTLNSTATAKNVCLLNAASVVNVVAPFEQSAFTENGTFTPRIGVTKSVNNASSASSNLLSKNYGQHNAITPASFFFADDDSNFMVADYQKDTLDWEGLMVNKNPANNWVNAINASLASSGSQQTVILYKDWNAYTSGARYTADFGSSSNHYRYGALYVPAGANIVLDLNGYTVNRNLSGARSNGYVIIVYGTLTIIDSSDAQTGKITGGKCSGVAGGVYLYQGNLTVTGGSVTGNVATNGAGVYVRTGSFSLGGNAQIYDNKNGTAASSVQKNIFLPNNGIINIVSPLTGDKKFGVSRNANGVFTNDYGQYHTAKPTNYFESENLDAASEQGYTVVSFGTGTALEASMLGFNLVDNWTYAVTASITYGEAQTFTLFKSWTATTNKTYGFAFGTAASSYKNGGLYVPKDADVILDLNGNTLDRNNKDRYVIYVEGKLTIIDSTGTDNGNVTGGNYGVYLVNGGICVIESGKISGNSLYGVYDDSGEGNNGGLVMSGGVITANKEYGVYEVSGRAEFTGGRVYFNGKTGVLVGEKGKLALGGKANIYTEGAVTGTDLVLDSSSVIDIVSQFEDGAKISFLREGLGQFTNGWSDVYQGDDSKLNTDMKYFVSGNSSYTMELQELTATYSVKDSTEIFITSKDGAINWQYAVSTSLKTNDWETCVLYEDWTAGSYEEFTTAFGATSAFVNGALFVPQGAKVILDLSGFDLNRNLASARASGYIIYVAGELKIIDSGSAQKGVITGGNNISSSSAGAIHIYNTGICTIDGVTISGNKAVEGGAGARAGAIYVAGTLNLVSGTITGNEGATAGGVYVSSTGTFNFDGGSIENNKGQTSSAGGVYTSGSFTMNGGSISKNNGSAGGAFVANGGTFTLKDGCVENNTGTSAGGVFVYSSTSSQFIMEGGSVVNNDGQNAGGVYVAGIAAVSGGTVSGNTSTSADANYGGGGGIYVANSGEVTITGGEITENYGLNGVRIYSSGVLNLGGSAKILNNRDSKGGTKESNVYLTAENKCVNIVSKFDGAKIGITPTLSADNKYLTGKFTNGYGTDNTAHPSDYFISDVAPMSVSLIPATDEDVAEASLGTPIAGPVAFGEGERDGEQYNDKIYNGNLQTIITGYDSEKMSCQLPEGVTLDGSVLKAVNAGDYSITFKPGTGFCWQNGSAGDLIVTATILPQPVVIEWDSDKLEFTYDGGIHTPEAKVLNPVSISDKFEIKVSGGSVDANLDGEKYTAEVISLGNTNYTLDDNSNKTIEFVIKRANITNLELADDTPTYNNKFTPQIANYPDKGAILSVTYTITAGSEYATLSGDGTYVLPTQTHGTIKVVATVAATRNYNEATTIEKEYEIQKGYVPVEISDLTYSNVPVDLVIDGYNEDEMGAVTFTDFYELTGSAVLENGVLTIKRVGEFEVTVNVEASDFYNATTKTIKFKVVPKLITIEWGDNKLSYTGSEQAPSATISGGLFDGTSCTIDVSGKQVYPNTAETPLYTATITDDCLSNKNYTVGSEPLTIDFTIAKADLDIKFAESVALKYKAEQILDENSIINNLGGGAVSYQLAGGISATLELDKNGKYVLFPNEKGDLIIKVIVEETDYYNYFEDEFTLNVGLGTVSVELKQSTVVYDSAIQLEIKDYGENGAVTFAMEGSNDFATISPDGLITATGVGTFMISVTVGATENYAETTVENIEVTIAPRPVVLKWTVADKYLFNGEEQAPEAAVTNLINDDSCTVTVQGAKDVGTHTAVAKSLSNPNYVLVYENEDGSKNENLEQEFVIEKTEITISLGSDELHYKTRFYPEIIGNLDNAKETYQLDCADTIAELLEDEDGKVYIWAKSVGSTINLTVTVDETDNCSGATETFPLVILKGYVPVELVQNTTVYGTDLALALKIAEEEAIGAVTFTVATEGSATGRAAISEAGNVLMPTQAGVVYLTVTVAESANYFYTEVNKVAVTVSALAVEIVWLETEFDYNGKLHTPTAQITNLVNPYDYYDLDISGGQIEAGENIYAEIISLGNVNYTLEGGTNVSVNYTINPLVVELEWTIGEYIYNGKEQAPEAKVTNLVVNSATGLIDECTVTVLGTKNAGDRLGAAAVGLSNSNYTLDGADDTIADYKISPYQIKIEWGSETEFVYDGEPHAPEARALGLFDGDTCEVTVTGKQTNVGEYTATAYSLSNSNYSISGLTAEERMIAYSIVRAQLTLEIDEELEVFYATPTKLQVITNCTLGVGSVTYTILEGSDIAIISGLDTIMGSDIGLVKVRAVAAETDNYTGAEAEGYIRINPRAFEFVWGEAEFDYDGKLHVPTVTIANLVGDDDCEFIVSSAQRNAGAYTATITLLDEVTKYTLEGSEFEIEFKINPRVVEIIWGAIEPDGGDEEEGEETGEAGDATLVQSTGILTYNGKEQAPEFTITNLAQCYDDNGDAILGEDGKPVYDTCGVKILGGSGSEGGEKNVGTGLTATIVELLNSNYTLEGSGNTGTTFDIVPLVVEIEWDSSKLSSNGREVVPTLLYNGDEQAPEAKIKNLFEGDVCDITVTGKQSEVSPSPEYVKDEDGEDIYLGYTAIIAALSNPNYTLVGSEKSSTLYRIIPAEMPVDLSCKYVEYGEELLLFVTGNIENGDIKLSIKAGAGTGAARIDEDDVLHGDKAGTVIVIISVGATENYVATTKEVTVIILPKLVEVEWGDTDFLYDGEEHAPEARAIIGYDDEGNPKYGEYLTVQGEIDAGTHTAYAGMPKDTNYTVYGYEYDEDGNLVLDGDGNPVTTQNVCYTDYIILPRPVTIEWVEGTLELKYTGEEQAPAAKVITGYTDGGEPIYDMECIVTVSGGQINVGTYTATVTGLSNSNYTLDGASNLTVNYKIDKSTPIVDIDLENKTAVFGKDFEFKFIYELNGVRTDKFDGELTYVLIDGKDYDVNDLGSAVLKGNGLTPTHVGTVKLVVYVGETLNTTETACEIVITIIKGTLPTDLVKNTITYGNSLNLALQNQPDDANVRFEMCNDLEHDGEAVIFDGVLTTLQAGVVYVRVIADESENYNATKDTDIVAVTILQRGVILEWTVGEYTYDGSEHAPTAVVKNLVSRTDENGNTVTDECEVTVKGAVHAGPHTAEVTALSNGNYKLSGLATDTKPFAIKPRQVMLDWSNLELEYNGRAQVPAATVKNLVSTTDEDGNSVEDECEVKVVTTDGNDAITVGKYTAKAFELANTDYTLDGVGIEMLYSDFEIIKAQLKLAVSPEQLIYGVETKLVLKFLNADGEYEVYDGEYKFVLDSTPLASLNADGLTVNTFGTGTIRVTVNLVETENVKADNTTSFEIDIVKAPLTIGLDEVSAEVIYGTDLELVITGNEGAGKVTFTIDTTQGTGSSFEIIERDGKYYLVALHGEAYNSNHVGTVHILVDIEETDNYQSVVQIPVSVTVTPLKAEIGWYDYELIYNGNCQAPTAKVENLIDGDTCDVLLSESSYKTNASSGNFAYAERLTNSDYTFDGIVHERVFEIGKKPISLAIKNTSAYFGVPVKLEVDGNEGNAPVTYTVSNGTGSATLEEREDGVYLIPTKLGTVIVSASVPETANHLAGNDMKLVTVEKNKMPIELLTTETVYGDDIELVIDGIIETASISISVTDITGSAYVSGGYLIPRKAGIVTVTVTTSETANYQSTMVDFEFVIKPRVVTLEWVETEFTYDGFEHAPVANATDLLGNDECEIIVTGGKINAGAYAAGTAKATAVTNPNYTVADDAFAPEFKILKARPPLKIITSTVTINVPTKLEVTGNYGKGSVSYMLESDDEEGSTLVRANISGDMFTGLVLGPVYVTAMVEETDNYAAGAASAIIIIEKPAVEFSLKETSVDYGGELEIELEFAEDYTDEGGERTFAIVEGGTGTAELTFTDDGRCILNATGAGAVKLTVTIAETTTYKLTVKEFEIEIIPNELKIEWVYSEEPYVYNGKEQGPKAIVLGLPEGVECEVIVKGNKDAGTGLTATATGLSNKNYVLASDNQLVSDAYDVLPLVVQIEWTETQLTYNGKAQTPVVTITNLAKQYGEDGEELTDEEGNPVYDVCEIVINVVEGEAVIVGSYNAEITEGELFSKNYTLTGAENLTAEFSIIARTVGIKWGETELTYTSEEQAPEAYIIDLETGEVIDDDCTVLVDGAKLHAGESYVASVTGLNNTNYVLEDGEYTTEFKINPARLQLEIGSLELAYNGKLQQPEVTPKPLSENDEITVTLSDSYKEIGEYEVTLSIGGEAVEDYYLDDEDKTLKFKIVVSKITITVSSVNKVVDTVGDVSSLENWYKFTIAGLSEDDANNALSEIFPENGPVSITPEFRLDGIKVEIADMSEEINYQIVPVISGASDSANYEVIFEVNDKYGILRIGSSAYLELKENSKYQFIVELPDDDGMYYRRTYTELGWVHGVDDLFLDTLVLGQVSPNTTVNALLENIVDYTKVKLYSNESELIFDCGKAADGIDSSYLDDIYEYAIGTGWYIVYNEFETIYISVLGDIDGNGYIDSTDSSLINAYVMDRVVFNDIYVRLSAYIFNDGTISSTDSSLLNAIIMDRSTIEKYYYYKTTEEE